MKYKFGTKEEFLAMYERTAGAYDHDRSSTYEGRRVDYLQVSLIKRIAAKAKAKKVLEAGAGTGRIMIPLVDEGYDCTALDPSKEMLAKLKKKRGSIKTKVGDIEKLPFKANTYDLTYTMHVLMHMATGFEKAFEEMYRVTKKGGLIVMDFPNQDSPWTKLAVLISPNKERTRMFRYHALRTYFKDYDAQFTGLFSYGRTLYKIPIVRNITRVLDDYVPWPSRWRTQTIVIVKKH